MPQKEYIPIFLTKKQENRFYSKVNKQEIDQCWEWQQRNKFGYGVFLIKGREYRAHRIAYYLHYNQDPGKLLVCHKCDNRLCVNPHHLFLGTYADNNADRNAKGRQMKGDKHHYRTNPELRPIGTRNGSAKLTDDEVVAIRNQYNELKTPHRQLAELFSVTKSTITRVLSGNYWKHVK